MRRSKGKETDPDLGVLAAGLLFRVQGELSRHMSEQGFDDVSPRHGTVLAFLDQEGIRPTELARLSGRNKQTIGAILDELENLGYITREPDPRDRRAKLIVPTARGRDSMRLSDQFVKQIEARYAEQLGEETYARFKDTLRTIVRSPP